MENKYVNGVNMYQFKAKDSELINYLVYLGSISKDFSVNNMKKTGINGYVYGFSVNFANIDVDNILDIRKYLMNKNSTGPIKRVFLNNQPCQATPTLININSNETLFNPFTVSFSKCGGSCNTTNDP